MYADEIARIIADLGIEGLHIEWHWLNRKYVSRHWTGTHEQLGPLHVIKIALKGWSYEDIVKAIAHELRHAWQFGTKVCVYSKGVYSWSGTQYCGPRASYRRRTVKYRKRPEEIDAYAYQDDAWKKLFGGKASRKTDTSQSVTAALFGAAFDT